MNNLQEDVLRYLDHCRWQKRLDEKTLKAYRIDLGQFAEYAVGQDDITDVIQITPTFLERYIANLHHIYRPKTVKRKIASLKALFHYLEYKEIIERNPFSKLQIKFREPIILPKTIPLQTVKKILSTIYIQHRTAKTDHQRRTALRDASVIELLFSTGMRISELCSLSVQDVNLDERTILIYGKGAKERRIQIGNNDVVSILLEYHNAFAAEIQNCGYFFVNLSGRPLTDQSVRRMIQKYCTIASVEMHITPHMFRHTFATSLLEADVDIRYIQEMLGHSSINITEIYTHVALEKQRDILATKHPRNYFNI